MKLKAQDVLRTLEDERHGGWGLATAGDHMLACRDRYNHKSSFRGFP